MRIKPMAQQKANRYTRQHTMQTAWQRFCTSGKQATARHS